MVNWMRAVGEKWAVSDVLRGLPINQGRRLSKDFSAVQHSTAHPGSFNVLFIEYAKCFPKDVNNSGR